MEFNSNENNTKLSPVAVTIFYSIFAVIGLVWSSFHEDTSYLVPFKSVKDVFISAGAGIVTGWITILIGDFLEKRVRALRELSNHLKGMLPNLTIKEITVFSIASAVGEEIFFRAGMLPSFGLIATSLTFGFFHGMFQKPYVAWGIFATVLGVVLGLLTMYTGNIVAAVICHFTINFFNFLELNGEES